jgi:hypothetical protein
MSLTRVPPTGSRQAMAALPPFCGSIAWLADRGISTGYADGGLRPAAQVTRQAMAAFLHRYPTCRADPAGGRWSQVPPG